MDADARLVNIEEKIAHLEHHLGELDGVVRETGDRVAGFKRQLEQMRTLLEEQAAASAGGPDSDASDDTPPGADQDLEDDRPPHW